MKQRWLVAVVGIAGLTALITLLLTANNEPASQVLPVKAARAAPPSKIVESSGNKPVCSRVIVPAGDCIPQHLANLPPDPGPEGLKTISGIDSDGDGVRDDLQRLIVLNWGHSERAVQALRLIAKDAQREIELGDSVTREQAYVIAKEMNKSAVCFLRSVDPAVQKGSGDALATIGAKAMNTEERFLRRHAFEYKSAHQVYQLPPDDTPLTELCGYEPANLPN